MTNTPNPDYEKLVKEAGLPTTASEWREILKEEMANAGSMINNNSFFSPFWRIIEACVITPTLWLINKFLIGYLLPNTFLCTTTGRPLDLAADAVDLTRKEAAKTKGRIVFYRAQSTGPALIIPANTIVQTEAINGTVYRMLTVADTTMPENEFSVEVAVEAEMASGAHNLAGGYYSILPIALNGISHAQNLDNWIDEAGADIESDDDLRLRIRNQWLAVGKWHIDATYRSILMEQSGIQDDNIFFEHDAPRGPGSANCYILLDTGNPSDELITSLNQHIYVAGYHGHGDDLLIIKLPETYHNIEVNVWYKDNLLAEQLTDLGTKVENFIRAAFRQNLDYSPTRTIPNSRFSMSRLGRELHREFETEIDSLDFVQTDIISGLEIARLGTLKINLAVS